MRNENQAELVRNGVAISRDDNRFVSRYFEANDAGRDIIASDVLASEFITAPSHIKKPLFA